MREPGRTHGPISEHLTRTAAPLSPGSTSFLGREPRTPPRLQSTGQRFGTRNRLATASRSRRDEESPFSLKELRQPSGHPGAEDTRHTGPYHGQARFSWSCVRSARRAEVPGCRARCLRKKKRHNALGLSEGLFRQHTCLRLGNQAEQCSPGPTPPDASCGWVPRSVRRQHGRLPA